MKTTIFKEVLNEELIEVDKSVPETIKRLQETCGISRPSQKEEMNICFKCSKKGKIFVTRHFEQHRDIRGLYLYYVYGEVISKDNKTYIRIISVYKKSDIWLRFLLLILSFFLFPIYVLTKSYINGFFVPAIVISLLIFITTLVDTIKITSIRKEDGIKSIEIMENAIKKRVKNIERWDSEDF